MKASPAQLKANDRYKKKMMKQYNLMCHIVNDADVIEMLNSQENKQGYIKALIRADMAKH